MKTPLSEAIVANWSESTPCQFPHTIASLLSSSALAKHRIGMILNLASHDSLYDNDLPTDGNIETHHVELTSKLLPSPDATRQVVECAREFWSRRPDDFIAIHCAYGAISPSVKFFLYSTYTFFGTPSSKKMLLDNKND